MTGYARALALFVLLAGIVAMHAAVFASASGGHHGGAAAASSHEMTLAAHSTTMPGDHTSQAVAHPATSDTRLAAPACPDGNCGPTQGGLHGCVFVLTAIALALALAVLYWVGVTRRDDTPVRFQWRRIRRARPPPWTVPSLADLAILRI